MLQPSGTVILQIVTEQGHLLSNLSCILLVVKAFLFGN
jgi:hypothetical protein